MTKVAITKEKIDTLAEVIAGKTHTDIPQTIDGMIESVSEAEFGGTVAPTLQSKSVSFTPSSSAQSETVTADTGYDGLDAVAVSVSAVEPFIIHYEFGSYDPLNINLEESYFDIKAALLGDKAIQYYFENYPYPGMSQYMGNKTIRIEGANYTFSDCFYLYLLEPESSIFYWVVYGYVNGVLTKKQERFYVHAHGNLYIPQSGITNVLEKATVTVPALTLPSSTSNSSSGTSKATIAAQTGADRYLNIPQGFNDTASYYTISPVASGTAGTPTASKGSVNNHQVSVTPSVTNTTGYITGSTINGTAVTVTASELASGNKEITSNGTDIDVVGYSTVSVNVAGSSGMQVATATATPNSAAASISFTNLQGEPTSFYIMSAADLATGASPFKTAAVVFDGTNIFGSTITNTSNAQVSYDSTHFSKTYSNGTLTVTGSTYWQANQYKLVYTYGGNSANIGTADVQVGSGATSITFTGLTDEPTCFSCLFKSDFSTSSGYQRVIGVVFDGTTTYGLAMDSGAKAATSWTYSYSNGSLTITSSGTNAGGYFHQPGYYQLTYGIGGEVELTVEPLSVTENGVYSESGKAYSPVTVNVSGGGSASFGTVTTTNSSNQNTSISFTLPSGRTPKAFFARLTSQIARNSNSRYYYVYDMRWDGSSSGGVAGNTFYMYNGTLTNVTSGYSYSQDGTTFTLSSTGSRSASPGSFYNGTYEMVYVY